MKKDTAKKLQLERDRINKISSNLVELKLKVNSIDNDVNSKLNSLESQINSKASTLQSNINTQTSNLQSNLNSKTNDLQNKINTKASSLQTKLDSKANKITASKSGQNWEYVVHNGWWGDWHSKRCDNNEFMCGVKIRQEKQQGSGDDSGTNGVKIICCPFRA